MAITKIEAVRSLFGRGSYNRCMGDGTVDWKDGHETTEEETAQINAEYDRLQTEDVVLQKRIKEYGSTAEQLEYIVENGVDAFITKQQQIKTDNPKE